MINASPNCTVYLQGSEGLNYHILMGKWTLLLRDKLGEDFFLPHIRVNGEEVRIRCKNPLSL